MWAHITLAELRALDDGSVLQEEWITEMAARWAACRAAASEGGGGEGGAWLDGKAARAMACDAVIAPVVTGDVDPGVLEGLVRLCVELDRLDHAADRHDLAGDGQADGQREASPSREALQRAIIGKAVICSRARAGWPHSCVRTSWVPGWPGPVCPWTSGIPRRSRPGSATR